MTWIRSLFLPPAGSWYAQEVDNLYLFLFWICVAFFVLITGMIAYCAVRYRRRSEGERTPHVTTNYWLELTWSTIPLVILMIIFFRGFLGYTAMLRTGEGHPLDIQVTAVQFGWSFDHAEGIREFGRLHVPVNQPVRLTMSSRDVIHSFYVPDLRLKQDVLPNRFVTFAFTPTKVGEHNVFCAEFCGEGHSDMWAKLVVDSPDSYAEFLKTGGASEMTRTSMEDLGAKLFRERSCNACHSFDGTTYIGPSVKHLYGSKIVLANGSKAVVDEAYLRASILAPQPMKGYPPAMPPYAGMLRERELQALVQYVKAYH